MAYILKVIHYCLRMYLIIACGSVFRKASENARNHRDIKLVTSDKRRKRLVSEPNYNLHKTFSEDLMAIEMKRQK